MTWILLGIGGFIFRWITKKWTAFGERVLDVAWALMWMSRNKRCLVFAHVYLAWLKMLVAEREAGRLTGKKLENANLLVAWMEKRMSAWMAEFAPNVIRHQ